MGGNRWPARRAAKSQAAPSHHVYQVTESGVKAYPNLFHNQDEDEYVGAWQVCTGGHKKGKAKQNQKTAEQPAVCTGMKNAERTVPASQDVNLTGAALFSQGSSRKGDNNVKVQAIGSAAELAVDEKGVVVAWQVVRTRQAREAQLAKTMPQAADPDIAAGHGSRNKQQGTCVPQGVNATGFALCSQGRQQLTYGGPKEQAAGSTAVPANGVWTVVRKPQKSQKQNFKRMDRWLAAHAGSKNKQESVTISQSVNAAYTLAAASNGRR